MRHAWLIALLAYAPARKPFGELSVSAVHEYLPQTRVVHEAVFRIESARIVAAGALAGTRLDLVATDDGCLRGESLDRPVFICPAPPEEGDPKSVYRWRGVQREIIAFSTQLLDYGEKLRVEANMTVAELPLPPGAAGDEMRRHPELLGAAFAIGLFPVSSDQPFAYQVIAR